MKFRFKPFQARLVACWIVAMGLSWAVNYTQQNKLAALKANPLAEANRQIQSSQKVSVIGLFWGMLIFIVVIFYVIEFIAKLLRSMDIDTSTDPVKND